MSKIHYLASATAALLLAGPLLAQTPAPQVKAVATVNGEAITTADLKKVLDQRPPMAQPLTVSQQRELDRTVVNMLVEDLLMPAIPAQERRRPTWSRSTRKSTS